MSRISSHSGFVPFGKVKPVTVKLGNVKFPKNELTVLDFRPQHLGNIPQNVPPNKKVHPHTSLPYRQRKTSKQL
jgi:hypothetical protein